MHLRRLIACVVWLAGSLFAQNAANPVPSSGVEWRSSPDPNKFFDVTGRHSAVFGRQTGIFEAWIYPVKILHGFRLEFQQAGMTEPVRGEAWLQEIITRPESTTLVYAHPLFTVRQTIFAPIEEQAIVQWIEVDSDKDLIVSVKFLPDLKPMWPASFGGQHTDWDDADKAFTLSDATSIATAMLGSPAVDGYTNFIDHSLISGEMLLRLKITSQQARGGPVPIVMSLGIGPKSEDSARTIYRRVLQNARSLHETRVSDERDFLARTLRLETPDEEFNRAFTWSKVAMHSGWVCRPVNHDEIAKLSGVPDVEGPDCGLVAGYGPSVDSERPGFAWWFGGDGLLSTWALDDIGDFEATLEELRFLKARQRADGKMMHEMSQSVDLVDWFGKYHFAYYHADTTPMYLYSLARHWERSGDQNFAQEFWDSAKKAYQYCLGTLDEPDGLMDNTKAGLGAVEGGALRGTVTKDIFLESIWVAGVEGMATLARAMHDDALAKDAETRAKKANESLAREWWNSQGHYLAFGLTNEGKRADTSGSWSAALLALSNGFDEPKAAEQAQTYAKPDLASDWGTRTLSTNDAVFDPTSYHNGTEWPVMQTYVALAEFRHGASLPAFADLRNTANLTGIQAPGWMPEHMNGERFLAGERSVPHQLFSSVGVIVPAVTGMLGIETAPQVALHPALPVQWREMTFTGLRLGAATISGHLLQPDPGSGGLTLQFASGQAHVPTLQAQVPFLSKTHAIPLVVNWSGGIGVVVPVGDPEPGARSSALKIIHTAESSDRKTVEITVAGLGGHTYSLDLRTAFPRLSVNGAQVQKTPDGFRLAISFEGNGWIEKKLVVRP